MAARSFVLGDCHSARLTAAYACGPDFADALFDLRDEEAARHLVRTYGLPGLTYLTQE